MVDTLKPKHWITNARVTFGPPNDDRSGFSAKVALFLATDSCYIAVAVVNDPIDLLAQAANWPEGTSRRGCMVRRTGESLAAPIPAILVAVYTDAITIKWGGLPEFIKHEDLPWINHPKGIRYDDRVQPIDTYDVSEVSDFTDEPVDSTPDENWVDPVDLDRLLSDNVTFDCNGHNAPAYGCNRPGDCSGKYLSYDAVCRWLTDNGIPLPPRHQGGA